VSCLVCSRDFERSRTGRPRVFCSDKCRQDAHRASHGTHLAPEATIATPEAPAPLPPPAGGARAYCHVADKRFGVHYYFPLAAHLGAKTVAVGPAFRTPREAIDYVRRMNARLDTPVADGSSI